MYLPLAVLLLLSPCLASADNEAIVDADGNINWPPLPPGQPYLTEGRSANTGGLEAFYDLSRSYIHSSLPEYPPVDTVKKIVEGKSSIAEEWQNLLKSFLGFVTSLVIGLLFTIIFPIVGCCFCCCRCCGNCGGKMIQDKHPRMSCRRRTYIGIVFVLVAFQAAGMICTFVTNNKFSENLRAMPEVANNSVADIMTFLDNLDQQFKQIIVKNTDFVKKTLTADTDITQMSQLIAESLVRDMTQNFHLDKDLDQIKQDVDSAKSVVNDMDQTLTSLKNLGLSTQLSGVETAVSDLKTKLDVSLIDGMETMVKHKIQSGVNTAMQGINVQQQINDMTSKNIDPMKDNIMNVIKEAKSSVKDLGIEKTVTPLVDTLLTYDNYRSYCGIGFASLLLLMVLLQGCGLVFGVVGHKKDVEPTERGSLTHSGGQMLMAFVGFLFMFGSLIMMLTTFLYSGGSFVERYMCQSLKNPSRLEKFALSISNMDLANLKFAVQGKTLTFSLSGILSSCERGETIYDAVHLDNVIDIHDMMDKVKDYKDKILPTDLVTKLDLSNLRLSAQTGHLTQQIDKLNSSDTQLSNVKTQLQNMRNAVSSSALAGSAVASLKKLEDDIKKLESHLQNLPTLLSSLVKKLQSLDNSLTTQAKSLIQKSVDVFTSRIFGIFESYVNNSELHLHTDLGSCRPVWTVYNTFLLKTVCGGFVDPLNGMWLALGWNIFFGLFALVFAVKLAKHFRRMEYAEEFVEDGLITGQNHVEGGSKPPLVTVFQNKVGPVIT